MPEMSEPSADAAPSSTEPVPAVPNDAGGVLHEVPSDTAASVPVAMPSENAGDAPNAVFPAVDASAGIAGSVMNAAGAVTSSRSAENSAEPKTFEQMVEERFLTLERAIAQIPQALYRTLSEGSHASPEAFAARVLQHLFGAL